MDDRSLDQHSLPDNDPIARREALLKRLNAKKSAAEKTNQYVAGPSTEKTNQYVAGPSTVKTNQYVAGPSTVKTNPYVAGTTSKLRIHILGPTKESLVTSLSICDTHAEIIAGYENAAQSPRRTPLPVINHRNVWSPKYPADMRTSSDKRLMTWEIPIDGEIHLSMKKGLPWNRSHQLPINVIAGDNYLGFLFHHFPSYLNLADLFPLDIHPDGYPHPTRANWGNAYMPRAQCRDYPRNKKLDFDKRVAYCILDGVSRDKIIDYTADVYIFGGVKTILTDDQKMNFHHHFVQIHRGEPARTIPVLEEPEELVRRQNKDRRNRIMPSIHSALDTAWNQLPAELQDAQTQKSFNDAKKVFDVGISGAITPTTPPAPTRKESLPDKLSTIVGAKSNPVVVAASLSPGDSPLVKGRKRERSPSVSEIDRKTFQQSHGQESPRPRTLSPSNTPPGQQRVGRAVERLQRPLREQLQQPQQPRRDQGAKVFVMNRNATHMQRACADIGDHFDISGIKSGTVDMRADLVERWINRMGLGNDPFLVPYGRMVDPKVRDEMAAVRACTFDGVVDD